MRIEPGMTALVTGAAGGIGGAMAKRLAERGVHLILADRREDALKQTADSLSSHPIDIRCVAFDLADQNAMARELDALIDAGPAIDLFFSCAGVCRYQHARRAEWSDFNELLDVNLRAPVLITTRLLRALPAELPADAAFHVALIGSMFGLLSDRKLAAYCTAEHGLTGFADAMWAEFAGTNIGVTLVCAGFVETGLIDAEGERDPHIKSKAPPRWLHTSPDRLARLTLRAVERNKPLIVVTPLARFVWRAKRFCPWLLRLTQRLRFVRWRRKKTQRREAANDGASI